MRKFYIPCFIFLSGILCFLYCTFSRQPFQHFTQELFCHELSLDILGLHYTLTDPSSYGIKEITPSLGNMNRTFLTEELSYFQNCLKKTEHYLNGSLNEKDYLTANILKWWLEGQIYAGELYYYQEPLGPTLGIQAQLPVLLAEFSFRNEDDVKIYLALLESIPEYFEQLGNFEKEKSQQGLFMNDEILDKTLEQCNSLFPLKNSHFLITSFQERLDTCDFLTNDQKISYCAQNLRILKDHVQPAYKQLCSTLETLRGTGLNPDGLYHVPDGIDYYEYLLKYCIGTDLGMAEIHRLLDLQMEEDYETILHALHEDIEINKLISDAPFQKTPSEILTNLQQQIKTDFPTPQNIIWEIKEVPSSLQEFLSPAFYMTPAIDAKEPNHIYINPAYTPDYTNLVTTLAHEGYPGHMYQNSFENDKDYHPVRNLIYVGGYTEGWGLYSELYAYQFLGLSDTETAFLRALSSLNYAICASLDLSIHGEGWTEEHCSQYLSSFGITDQQQIHELYLNILAEPANYLKYYLGYLEICKLKESAFSHSPELTLYDFHKWFLETGPAPFFLMQERLQFLKVSAKLFQGTCKDFQLLAIQPFHDRLNHSLMKSSMFFIGDHAFFRQRKKHNPLIVCTANAGNISLFHQTVNGGG